MICLVIMVHSMLGRLHHQNAVLTRRPDITKTNNDTTWYRDDVIVNRKSIKDLEHERLEEQDHRHPLVVLHLAVVGQEEVTWGLLPEVHVERVADPADVVGVLDL